MANNDMSACLSFALRNLDFKKVQKGSSKNKIL